MMRTLQYIVVAAIGLALVCGGSARAAQPQVASASAPLVKQTIVSNGQTREYWFYRPAGLSAAKTPLEIVLYPDATPATDMPGYEALADQAKFQIAVPISRTTWKDPADIPFIGDVIDSLVAKGTVDPDRVYVTGGSGSGFEAYKVACGPTGAKIAGVGGLFAGIIAPTAGQAGLHTVCQPTHPMSVIEVHGTRDDFVPYNGWACKISESGKPSCLPSQPDLMAFWAGVGGCNQTPTTTSAGVLRLDLWGSCTGGVGVELATVTGGGHTPDSLTVGGVTPEARVWNFLSTHARVARVAPAAQLRGQIVSVKVTKTGTHRTLALRLTVSRAVTARISLLRGSSTVASRVLHLTAGTARAKLAVPKAARSGSYKLKITLRDSSAKVLTLTRTFKLPR